MPGGRSSGAATHRPHERIGGERRARHSAPAFTTGEQLGQLDVGGVRFDKRGVEPGIVGAAGRLSDDAVRVVPAALAATPEALASFAKPPRESVVELGDQAGWNGKPEGERQWLGFMRDLLMAAADGAPRRAASFDPGAEAISVRHLTAPAAALALPKEVAEGEDASGDPAKMRALRSEARALTSAMLARGFGAYEVGWRNTEGDWCSGLVALSPKTGEVRAIAVQRA